MELKWKLHQAQVKWRATTGTRVIMDVHRGTLVKAIAVRVGEIFNNLTDLTIGDSDSDEGYGVVTHGSLQLENLAGVFFDQYLDVAGAGANGKLYTADDTIIATLTVSNTPTTGEAIVYVVYCEIE